MEKMSEKQAAGSFYDLTEFAQIEKLRAENAQLKKDMDEAKGIAENYRLLSVGLAEKCADSNARVKELERFLEHDEECPMHYANECTCGLEALLKSSCEK